MVDFLWLLEWMSLISSAKVLEWRGRRAAAVVGSPPAVSVFVLEAGAVGALGCGRRGVYMASTWRGETCDMRNC